MVKGVSCWFSNDKESGGKEKVYRDEKMTRKKYFSFLFLFKSLPYLCQRLWKTSFAKAPFGRERSNYGRNYQDESKLLTIKEL